MSKYNWPLLKREYVEGYEMPEGGIDWPTYDSLAAKYSIDKDTIAKHGLKEGWKEARKTFQTKIDQEYFNKKAKQRAKDADMLDQDCITLSRTCIGHIKVLLTTVQNRLRETGEPIDPKTLEAIGRSLERFQRVGKIAMGQYIGQTPPNEGHPDDGFIEALKKAIPEAWKDE